MEYIIGGLVLLLALYVIGYTMKKKLYKEIDRLENWKIDITNRPVLDEMSKVKQLNMTGETEELFENWRNDWDDIVTSQLPEVEEYLFDAEEYIDRYRFNKAKRVQRAIDSHLKETEDKIQRLLDEINELVGSEEKNRIEIEELKEVYRERRKTLLAHRHNFGRAEAKLEVLLDEIVACFTNFEERTENGDYLQAREVVLFIQSKTDELSKKMDAIPNLLIECQSSIPSEIENLRDGFREMQNQGYPLEHLHFEEELEKLHSEENECLELIEQTEIDELQKKIDEVKDKMEVIYDQLEQEVNAKRFVIENEEPTRRMLFALKEENNVLKFEVQEVLQSYHLEDSEVEGQAQFEKKLAQLMKRFEVLEHKIVADETALTILKDELAELKLELEKLDLEQKEYAEKLQTLRKDEITARETVVELSKKIADCIRLVNKSNIPGLPEEYRYLLEDARESISNVKTKLDEKPLNIPTVQKYLEVAVMTVDKVHDHTSQLIETVLLSEKVIQYGNRYRSSYPTVQKALVDAEMAFRSYDYQAALEVAATSIEEVEPGALKRIEALLQETVEI